MCAPPTRVLTHSLETTTRTVYSGNLGTWQASRVTCSPLCSYNCNHHHSLFNTTNAANARREGYYAKYVGSQTIQPVRFRYCWYKFLIGINFPGIIIKEPAFFLFFFSSGGRNPTLCKKLSMYVAHNKATCKNI